MRPVAPTLVRLFTKNYVGDSYARLTTPRMNFVAPFGERRLSFTIRSLVAAGLMASAPLAYAQSADAPPTPRLKPLSSAIVLAARQFDAPAPAASVSYFDLVHDTRAYVQQRTCLSQAIYYEARAERLPGRLAVAEVVLNRVESSRFPDTICDVVYQGSEKGRGCQFSFVCDGSMRHEVDEKSWRKAQALAEHVLLGFSAQRNVSGDATHYHADYVSPIWAKRLTPTAQIGAHRFYRTERAGG